MSIERYNKFKNALINKKAIIRCKLEDKPGYGFQDQETKVIDLFNSFDFWDYFTIYHLEQANKIQDHSEKLTYLRRLPPQFENLKNVDYKNFIREESVNRELCNEFIKDADLAKDTINARIQDLERYLNEKIYVANSQSTKTLKTDQLPDTQLKALFKDGTKYNEVIQLLMAKGIIVNTVDGLIWIGYRKGRKYDLVAFISSLSAKGFLNQKVDVYKSMKPIIENSFLNFSVCEKTFGNKKQVLIKLKFDNLLNSI